MKSIRKITDKVTDNFSALAGSALLVGATLTGGAAFAAASSHTGGSSGDSMDLGDYPHPFVDEDGEVETSIVLGSDAAVTDVVGATEIAGSLGAAAFGEESVSTGSGSFGFTASNGVTLDTRNDQLYFGDALDTVRETLTEDDLEILSETTFTDDNNDETDVTNYLNVGSQEVVFGNGADELDDEDPELHVEVPSESSVDSDNYLFNLQANFEDGIDFTSSDVAGEEIELFGTEYTVADDMEDGNDGELLLYGSQQDVDVDSGESTTITVNEEEVTIEVVSVNEGSTSSDQDGNAAVRVDGTLESVSSGDTISVNNEEVRIDEIIKTGGSDSSSGVVNFRIGSQELTLVDGEPIQDSDDDDIEGSRVYFNGHDKDTSTLVSDLDADDTGTAVSSIDLYVGAENDDQDALTSGDTFSHSALPGVEVQFGGLNPNAAEDSDSVSEVEFSNNGDDTATVDFTADGGDDASIDFTYADADTLDSQYGDNILADSDGDKIQSVEGYPVEEDEYFLSDAGDFSHMWEVTEVDWDSSTPTDTTVDLRDVVTGESVEVEFEHYLSNSDSDSGYDTVLGTEVIDGQKYKFRVNQKDSSDDSVNVVWGDGAEFDTAVGTGNIRTGSYTGGAMSLFPALDTESGSAIAFAPGDVSNYEQSTQNVYEFPSTESTDAQTITVDTSNSGTDVVSGAQDVATVSGEDALEVTVGSLDYRLGFDGDPSSAANIDKMTTIQFTADQADQIGDGDGGVIDSPAAAVIQPEDDDDEENAYIVRPGVDNNDNEMDIGASSNIAYTGGSYSDLTSTLESDDDVEVGYNQYGTYTEQDTDDQGTFTLNLPDGQSVAGAAVTGADGSLEMGGGSGSVQAASPTYQYADGLLTDDGSVGQARDNENLVLVGGPAANSLTQDLVDQNQTMPAGDYTSGQGMIQMVDGFSEGNSALVVAGATGEDTRTAAEFLADYRNNQDALEGNSQVTIETSSGSVVN